MLRWDAATDRAGYAAGEVFDCAALLDLSGTSCYWIDDRYLALDAPDEVVVGSSLTVSAGMLRATCVVGDGVRISGTRKAMI